MITSHPVNGMNVRATESTHRGFEEATVIGMLKSRFRAGVRGDRKINTRMRVSVAFDFQETIA